MIDVVKLATFLETKLNANSQGLVFRTYTFEKALDKRYEPLTGGVKVNFIPSIITTPVGSYLPLNDIQGARLSFNLEIMLPLADKDNWLDMLNAFVWSINGKIFYVTSAGVYATTYASGSTTVKMTCQVASFGAISPENYEEMKDINSVMPINKTENYILINVPISLKTVYGFVVGDEASVYLTPALTTGEWTAITSQVFATYPVASTYTVPDVVIADTAALIAWLNANGRTAVGSQGTLLGARGYNNMGGAICVSNPCHYLNLTYIKLKAIDFSIKNAKVPATNDFIDATTATTFNKENDVKYVMSAYYERTTILDNLVADIALGTNMNKNYWLKMIFPSATQYVRVVALENNVMFPIDDYALIPLAFGKAYSYE